MKPLELASKIEQRYRDYLRTTFYFRDPQLRASFEEALAAGRLIKGPYLEATPIFKRGVRLRDMFEQLTGAPVAEGVLTALYGDRPLYAHQERAIRAVAEGRNVVVATGTGSGKTEAFLYPILLHLYKEFQRGELVPGVRALVLYPMNALANDQCERLGQICQALAASHSEFRFTFGQYIGETPEDEREARALGYAEQRLSGQLLTREEMRDSPPHILLTNFSMLEYLLLRPMDSLLFDGGRARWWTFLVVDEAHQYRGSKGAEVAMLLRRLKERLRRGGRQERLLCIATSATLASGEADREAVAVFATELFGEKFEPEDVILADVEEIYGQPTGRVRLAPEDYVILENSTVVWTSQPGSPVEPSGRDQLLAIAARAGVQLNEKGNVLEWVATILQLDERATCLRQALTEGPKEVKELADRLFPDAPEQKRVRSLGALVNALARAQAPSGATLLNARYHLFVRSLQGAFLSYFPKKTISLEPGGSSPETAAFEVALCRECGQHYLVGREKGGRFSEAVRDPAAPDFGATYLLPLEDGVETPDEGGLSSPSDKRVLCTRCGVIAHANLPCGHAAEGIAVLRQPPPDDEDRADQMARCAVCGYHGAGRDPVREVVHGADGPNVVIATTLFDGLPEDRRKVLAFADGRQEAAFFAWYLEDSYRDILSRGLILEAARRLQPFAESGLSLGELATSLRQVLREHGAIAASAGDLEALTEAWRLLYRELLTDEQRISLEGVGLVRWRIQWPPWMQWPDILYEEPWGLERPEIEDLCQVLLDTMRADRAVEITAQEPVNLTWNDMGLPGAQVFFRIGPPGGHRNVKSWDGATGRRARYLAKLLSRIHPGEPEPYLTDQAVLTARQVWEAFQQADTQARVHDERILLRANAGARLNPRWWRLQLIEEQAPLYQCNVCGRLQAISVREVCPRHGCPGSLRRIAAQDLPRNHYRLLYEQPLPGQLRVEEHTAQLDKAKAREFQREFREGKIHVLSCSTTFELGVDLGDLDAIFLRNVPPEAFNYAQRVGRSGRRSGWPGFAVTYCRRSPHDLYHFVEPKTIIAGSVRPPTLSLKNAKIIGRHVMAVALSEFFKAYPERFENVKAFCADVNSPRAVDDLRAFLLQRQRELEDSLKRIVPYGVFRDLGLTNGNWIHYLVGKESRLRWAESELAQDYRAVVSLRERASKESDPKAFSWAVDRARTIEQEDVLSFLSRKAVIPKYGFPVDVVELDTQRNEKNAQTTAVSLQRDLSIAVAEFAPTNRLVANKKEWASYGLKRVPERAWDRKRYMCCPADNVLVCWNEGEPQPPSPCQHRLHPGVYIVPIFGFVTDRNGPGEPRGRRPRLFSTRPYFAGAVGASRGALHLPTDVPVLTMTRASPGRMVVLCEGYKGKRFYVCESCGAGFRSPARTHKDSLGVTCAGTLHAVALAHEFITDVLQLQLRSKPPRPGEPLWSAFSVAYALLQGAAEVLEVPLTDLSATVAPATTAELPPIVLYDNVPGGAGLVARLEDIALLRECVRAALQRVSGRCGCAESISCYGCLRSYYNQFAHEHLRRGDAVVVLERVLRALA